MIVSSMVSLACSNSDIHDIVSGAINMGAIRIENKTIKTDTQLLGTFVYLLATNQGTDPEETAKIIGVAVYLYASEHGLVKK